MGNAIDLRGIATSKLLNRRAVLRQSGRVGALPAAEKYPRSSKAARQPDDCPDGALRRSASFRLAVKSLRHRRNVDERGKPTRPYGVGRPLG